MDSILQHGNCRTMQEARNQDECSEAKVDAYFSADVETDGPIPGPFSMLSFALVYAGSFDGTLFRRPNNYELTF